MEYQYKLIISNKGFYKEFEIPADMERAKVGTTSACEYRLNPDYFFGDLEMQIEKSDGWVLTCPDNLYVSRGDVRKLYFIELVHGDVVDVCYSASGEVAFQLRLLIDFEAEALHYCWSVDLRENSITIGDQSGSNIQLISDFGKGTMLELSRTREGYVLIEKKSRYGVYVNGKRITGKAVLRNGDFISVADFSAYFKEDHLYFDIRNVRVNRLAITEDYVRAESAYPMFVRNTRVKAKADTTPIKVLDPATEPTKPELNIVTSLMPSLAMFALVVVLRGILSTTGGTFVLFSICSMGLGVITSIVSIFDKKKKYRVDCEKRIETYTEYIAKKKEEIQAARDAELRCLQGQYYSTEKDLEHIFNFSPELFDRKPEDDDFLDTYLGTGTTKAAQIIDYKIQEKIEVGDDLTKIPAQIAADYKCIEGAPVVIKLKEANAVGVVGTEEELYAMMKNMVIDIASRQYYGDVRIYALLGDDWEKYDWIRLLPHIQGGARQRNIVCDNESKNNIFENLYKELTVRSESKYQSGYNIVFVMEDHGIKSHPISRFIEKAASLNTVFVFFETKRSRLPLYCSNIIEMDGNGGASLYQTENKTDIINFQYKTISDEIVKKAVEMLAPVYCEEISLEGSLRKSISLFELLNIYGVNDLNLNNRWSKSKIYDSMAVPLGVNAKDDVVYLDLHEKYHGPHGLVAGTTGSGKSEILQTYILGAATLFHPYEIGFVIIDFKGGGMVNQFTRLPHLIGAITNIDGKAIDRSLKSIKAELLKRQELFAEAEVNHIDKYIKAYKAGKARIALPHLVIIVDEFAELKADQPEFMKELISAARIGRSLGVHLILATQKPAGQVNEQIWSNSKFKLCLKVQTREDSNEVIKSPLAAEIREPGRAYLQVGNNELFELLQSGYSGSPEKSDASNMKPFEIDTVDFKGTRKQLFVQKPPKSNATRTQLQAVVEYVHDYCEKSGIASLPPICLPDLDSYIVFDQKKYAVKKNLGISIPIGIYDDPDHQKQDKVIIDVGSSNTMIIGSAQYGKTNLLEVFIRGIAEAYSPSEASIYIIDFGSMVLKNFESLAHVGGVVCPTDDERFKNLMKYLNDQIIIRREKLLAVGVSSFISYKEAGYKDIPQIVVFIDNFTALKELYLQDNDILLNLCREGLSVGISFVVANAQTSGLGYKYMANFATRIALFCNEPSEYSTIFGFCRMRPDEKPGRALVEIDKTLLESQMFLAFEGEREIERVSRMQELIKVVNNRYANEKADPIPEIPKMLTDSYMFEKFGRRMQPGRQIIGLGYDSVAPVVMDLKKTNILSLIGPENSGKSNFIKYWIHSMERNCEELEVFIFDDYKKKLAGLDGEDTTYSIQPDYCKETIMTLDAELSKLHQKLIMGQEIGNTWRLLVLNNEDAFLSISSDRKVLDCFKNIIGKYKMLNVFVLLGNVPNAQVVYGAPEIYKIVKESRSMLFFDNMDNCKIIDIPLSIVRINKKKIETGDAYYIAGNDYYKVKTPLVIN